MLEQFSSSDLAAHCRSRIDGLELWLRRIVHEALTPEYGNILKYEDEKGNRLIKGAVSGPAIERMLREPDRYQRPVDALLLNDIFHLICDQRFYKKFFEPYLVAAFPVGREQALKTLEKLNDPRNRLAHAHPISVRSAEQVICYTGDVIGSIKERYAAMGLESQYNVPLFLGYSDSMGRMQSRFDAGVLGDDFQDHGPWKVGPYLRPGDILRIDVEVDPSFSESDYALKWRVDTEKVPREGKSLIFLIEDRHVRAQFHVECALVYSKNDWHRLGDIDDRLTITYRVLPPP